MLGHNDTWWSSFAEKQAKLNNCQLFRLFKTDKNATNILNEKNCREMLKIMNQTDSYKTNETDIFAFMAVVFKDPSKHESKRDILLAPNIIAPAIKIDTNFIFDSRKTEQPKNGSIIDQIITNEINTINETKKENAKIKAEIEKKENILKRSSVKDQEDTQLSMFDVKKSEQPSNVMFLAFIARKTCLDLLYLLA
ncbi:hypothetical protein MXB_4915 [Myxobolus squamalis]|nr:hypothetical protein MXB_4915 [Myxobolus squamalis]